MTHFRSIDLSSDSTIRDAAAEILVNAFRGISPSWPTHATAYDTFHELATADALLIGAFLDQQLVGFIGAVPQYGGTAWELHPLAVAPQHARNGIGTALLQHLCQQLQDHGAATVFVWCDDESAATSLGGSNVYPAPLDALATLVSGPRHAGGFYLKNDFCLTGILPDANGFGKHDILYARRITPKI